MAAHTEAKRLTNMVLDATTHYDALGVPTGADAATIKEAHRALARVFHPDRCAIMHAHDVMARVNGAYAVLSDKDARRKYDATLRIQDTQCPTCKGKGVVLRQKGFSAKVQVICPVCKGSGSCA